MLVMKFGGSSVADRRQIDKVIAIVRAARARRPLVVCSAHKAITDALVRAAREAAAGRYCPDDVLERQRAVARACDAPADLLESLYGELTDLLRGIHLVRELSPRSLDF